MLKLKHKLIAIIYAFFALLGLISTSPSTTYTYAEAVEPTKSVEVKRANQTRASNEHDFYNEIVNEVTNYVNDGTLERFHLNYMTESCYQIPYMKFRNNISYWSSLSESEIKTIFNRYYENSKEFIGIMQNLQAPVYYLQKDQAIGFYFDGIFLNFLWTSEYLPIETFNLQSITLNGIKYDQQILDKQCLHEIIDEIAKAIDFIININLEKVGKLLLALWDLLLDLIIYFCNFGLTVVLIIGIILHETFTKEEKEIKTSPSAKSYLYYQSQKVHFLDFLKQKLLRLWEWIKNRKRPIVFHIFLLLVSNGVMYLILVEFIIFIEVYFIRLINLEMYQMIFSIFKYAFVQLYPLLRDMPKFILIISLIILVFVSAVSRANYKLRMNHARLKKFVREDITQTTFINGPPGSGKTLLNSSLTLIAEENYIDQLEENMMNYQINYPDVNFAEVRLKLNEKHPEYFKNYDLLVNRDSFITSNYSIYSPYYLRYSKIFDFDWMRKNIKVDKYPLEEYIVISISELDKEYNSHDDMKVVGSDGAATFYSTVSHDLKRHVKIFCDYQLKDQVPLRIRGNSEYFYTIESRKKKYPILLYLYYLPFIILRKTLIEWIEKYESKKKTINKKTERKGPKIFKRNDYSLIYGLLRYSLRFVDKICKWFDHYWYFKISGDLSYKDGEKGEKKNLNINLCDLEINDQKIYDSTFLSFAYESKKNFEFRNLDTFTSLTPSVEELTKCNSRFYNKLNGLNDQNKEKDKDDFIDL